MNKFYSCLHKINSNFQKRLLSICLLLFFILLTVLSSNAQCVPPPAPVVVPNPAIMCLGDAAIKLKVVAPNMSQFCSGPVNIAVPDNNTTGASSSISVTGISPACTITGMTVTINMTHTRISNMVFVLKAPSGQVLNLVAMLNRTNNPGANFTNTVINSSSTMPLGGSAPYTGTFQADAAGATFTASGFTYPGGPTGMVPTTPNWVSLFVGTPNGNWTLGFYDGITGDVGTLTSWCLGITYSCPPGAFSMPAVWSPSSGLYSNASATIPYIAGTAIDSVWARPLPAGTYTYAVITQSLPGPLASFTNPATVSIPVGGAAALYPSNITVGGLPLTTARVYSVVLHGISHTRSNDIDIVLQSPSGQNVILMSDVGGANPINGTYTFTDRGTNMSFTSANPTGTYQPGNSGSPDNFPAPGPGLVPPTLGLSNFMGNLNGLWKLFVVDDDGSGDQGLISGGYTINFDTVAPCFSPPTYVPVTVGLPISITAQPVNKTICTDGVATFTIAASGAGTLNYQWQVSSNAGSTYTNLTNGGVYSGVTTANLSITAPPVSMSGFYYRVVINGTAACAAATSAFAVLTVNPLPAIVISANPLIVLPGMPTTIHSTVSPNPAVTYTWLRNGSVVAGATADTLVVDINGLGDYQLRVTDINGCSNLSNIITITDRFALNLFVYPNPSTGQLQARYYSEPNTSLPRSLIVYDNMGNRVVTKSFTQTISYQQTDIDLRRQGTGLYWVELVDEHGKRLALSRVLIH